ncbi:ornithine cyclodeaminase family protein [Kribbella deserti]|uniref:Ornithine cyclodeaminase family protein n=1 Tax=Kribbella deserti TaxID=1926257 RepID=A0ABV6QVV7_9ACTN
MKSFSADQVRRAVPMAEAIRAVRQAFFDLQAGHFVLPPREVFGDGKVLVMSAYHSPTNTAVVKTIGIDLDRVPAVQATVVWTGARGQVVADGATLTTLRTGAVVGVATDLLARPGAIRLTLIGTGAQAADQVHAVLAVRPIEHVTIVGRDLTRASTLAAVLAHDYAEVLFTAGTSIDEAIGDADVVCCATSSSTPLFELSALPERAHVNAIGAFRPSMCELPLDLLADASVVVVDQLEAALAESGEIIDALAAGLPVEPVELGAALASPPAPRGRTVFKSVGLAAQDWAVTSLLA